MVYLITQGIDFIPYDYFLKCALMLLCTIGQDVISQLYLIVH